MEDIIHILGHRRASSYGSPADHKQMFSPPLLKPSGTVPNLSTCLSTQNEEDFQYLSPESGVWLPSHPSGISAEYFTHKGEAGL